MTTRRFFGLVLDHAPLTLLFVAVMAAVVLSFATTPDVSWGSLPTAEDDAIRHADTEQASLLQAQAVTVVSAGLTCWDPSTGRVGSRIVVEWTDSGEVQVIPFTDAAYGQALAGEFTTLRTCA